MARKQRRSRSIVSLAVAYADQSDESLTIPEDLTTLSAEELAELTERAETAFDALYGDGQVALDDEAYAVLAALTTGIEAMGAEQARREEAEATRRDEQAALAARIRPAADETGEEFDVNVAGATLDDVSEIEEVPADEEAAADADELAIEEEEEVVEQTVVAGGSRTINLPANRRQRRAPQRPAPTERSMRDVAYATADTLGVPINTPLDHAAAGRMLDRRLASFPQSTYAAAAVRGQHIREQHSLMAFKRDIPKGARVNSQNSVEDAQKAIQFAIDMSRLPGGTLTAAGWCAPSETLYDLCTTATRDGLLSIPEVGISRGGIRFPTQPSFADLWDEIGFCFTEEQAIDGEFAPGANPGDPNVVGDKPCYEMPCPTWEDHRLEGCGVCLTGDLITQRGYPEGLAWATENALIIHDHKMSANRIAKIVAGSTAVTATAGTPGTTAPLLAAIEVQVEDMRYAGRLSRSALLEMILPFWIRGAIRQDLSVRLGVDLLSVTNAQIDSWFALRGVVPQYVYDWQSLPQNAKTWPTTVQVVIYEAGAWIGGVDDIITLDTIYDSTLLGQNKFTALFTEDAYLVAKRCGDSRVVTVPVCSDGTTHAGVLLNCDLAPTPAP